MKTNYKNIKNNTGEKTLAVNPILLNKNYFAFTSKSNIKKNVKNSNGIKRNKDLSRLKYDEDCGE